MTFTVTSQWLQSTDQLSLINKHWRRLEITGPAIRYSVPIHICEYCIVCLLPTCQFSTYTTHILKTFC